MNYWKLGCRWYTNAPLFFDYLVNNKIVISWTDKKFGINDIVLLTDGYTAIGIARVKSNPISIVDLPHYKNDFDELEIPSNDKNLLVFDAEFYELNEKDQFLYKLQPGIRQIQKQEIIDIINKLIISNKKMAQIEDKIKLLKYKKQIILQGPPGTGKTREAKLIANNIFLNELNENSYFGNNLIKNETIFSVAKNTKYRVKSILENYIELEGEDIQDKKITKNKIIDFVKDQNWNAVSNGNDRGAQAIAYHLYQKFIENQFKLIQFHPSYTYEDFVRGIVAKPNPDGEGILYEVENKTLGDFATKALDNYNVSKGLVKINSDFESKLNVLIEKVNNEINAGKTYLFGDKSTAEIISVGNDYFLYNFPQRETIRYKILFSDLKKVYSRKDEIKIPIDLRDRESDLQLVMKGKYPYYYMLLRQLEDIAKPTNSITDTTLKNYILIIDEINRANLSSVLGELIYALEYRGEEVESMYEVDGSQKLILPPNLFIIGTMNTADRSVGHIDYAIRRRFAFVEVLPKDLSSEVDDGEFYTDLFSAVKALFTRDEYQTKSDFISQEFEPKDVALGHSYFIDKTKDGGDIKTRWNYEIKPILLEYIRDGVLKESALEQVISIETTFDLKIQ